MRCTSCGEFIYKGKKFNAKKEDANESYYNIRIYRFYIRCTKCSSEITFKTDPERADYTAERGAQRNFEPWREQEKEREDEEARLKRLEEEENAMQKLESKTVDSRREMEIMDALDDIRMRNARNERMTGGEDIMEKLDEAKRNAEQLQREAEEKEIEEAARRAFENVPTMQESRPVTTAPSSTTTTNIPSFIRNTAAAPKRKNGAAALGITVKKKAVT